MSALLTNPSIEKALREIKRGRKTAITLTDAAPRGAGRLLLIVKPERAEWYARRIADGKKRLDKLGTYPVVSLADARERFKAAPVAAMRLEAPASTATIGEMFDAYLARLRADGKPSLWQAEKVLGMAGEAIGRSRPAGSVTPGDIVQVLKPIYDRGARSYADKFRVYLGAAFRWAMQATHDYKVASPRDWGVKINPVDAVPHDEDADGVGNRWLSLEEYDALMGWLLSQTSGRTPVDKALLLEMLTGQRITEILKLTPAHWSSRERLLTWETTKNGRPHVLPVCARAAAILDGLTASDADWFFPNESGPDQHMPHGTARMRIKRYVKRFGVPTFTTRDLRRTWKTLAGEAGLSKAERDMLQNHTEADVSSKHYDRYDNLREKRAAVAKWEAWLEAQIKKGRG